MNCWYVIFVNVTLSIKQHQVKDSCSLSTCLCASDKNFALDDNYRIIFAKVKYEKIKFYAHI